MPAVQLKHPGCCADIVQPLQEPLGQLRQDDPVSQGKNHLEVEPGPCQPTEVAFLVDGPPGSPKAGEIDRRLKAFAY